MQEDNVPRAFKVWRVWRRERTARNDDQSPRRYVWVVISAPWVHEHFQVRAPGQDAVRSRQSFESGVIRAICEPSIKANALYATSCSTQRGFSDLRRREFGPRKQTAKIDGGGMGIGDHLISGPSRKEVISVGRRLRDSV